MIRRLWIRSISTVIGPFCVSLWCTVYLLMLMGS